MNDTSQYCLFTGPGFLAVLLVWLARPVIVKLEIKISTLCDNYYRPLKTLFSVNEAFKNTEGNIGQKFVFVLGNLANVGLAM